MSSLERLTWRWRVQLSCSIAARMLRYTASFFSGHCSCYRHVRSGCLSIAMISLVSQAMAWALNPTLSLALRYIALDMRFAAADPEHALCCFHAARVAHRDLIQIHFTSGSGGLVFTTGHGIAHFAMAGLRILVTLPLQGCDRTCVRMMLQSIQQIWMARFNFNLPSTLTQMADCDCRLP